MSRFEFAFLGLILAQAAHSVEEYCGRLWEVFPPAALVSSLIAADPRIGFVIINTALVAIGLWCFFWPVRRRWKSVGYFAAGWITLETINGVGHPLWSLRQQAYTPGVATAPVLLFLALYLAWQLKCLKGHSRDDGGNRAPKPTP